MDTVILSRSGCRVVGSDRTDHVKTWLISLLPTELCWAALRKGFFFQRALGMISEGSEVSGEVVMACTCLNSASAVTYNIPHSAAAVLVIGITFILAAK